MNKKEDSSLIIFSFILLLISMVGFLLLIPKNAFLPEESETINGQKTSVIETAKAEADKEEENKADKNESDKAEEATADSSYVDFSQYKYIVFGSGNGFEGFQITPDSDFIDPVLLEGQSIFCYVSSDDEEVSLMKANDLRAEVFVDFKCEEKEDIEDFFISIYYDDRYVMPGYDSKCLAQDVWNTLAVQYGEDKVKLEYREDTNLKDARIPSIEIHLEFAPKKAASVKDEIAKEVMKFQCKRIIQKERG